MATVTGYPGSFCSDMDKIIETNDILKYAINNGMIDVSCIQTMIEMEKRKEYLNKHEYKIWQGQDGKWYTYLPGVEKKRVLKKRSTREEIENVIVSYWKGQMENPTIEEVFNEWNDRRLELNKISRASHLRYKQIFNRFYRDLGGKRIKSITPEEIEDFLEEQISQHDLTAKAFSNLKTVTKGFLKRAKKRKLIMFNVEEMFQEMDTSDNDFHRAIKEDYEEVYSEEEMPKMISYLEKNLDSLNIGILLMFVTGIRVGELVTLKHDVFDGNTFKIRRTETRYLVEKGQYAYEVKEFPKSEAGVRTVVIPEDYRWLCSKIRMLNPFGDYIFVNDNGERITTNSIRRRLERNCRKLGIYQKSPHKIRKTYGTILLDNNVDKQLIMGQMGHSDILCTETHYHRNRRTVERKSEILSAIPDFKKERYRTPV